MGWGRREEREGDEKRRSLKEDRRVVWLIWEIMNRKKMGDKFLCVSLRSVTTTGVFTSQGQQ